MLVIENSFELGTAIALVSGENIKTYENNIVPVKKLALVAVVFCAAMFAFNQNASATRRPLPPSPNAASVPDAGATIMLLATAFGALGIVRRFIKK